LAPILDPNVPPVGASTKLLAVLARVPAERELAVLEGASALKAELRQTLWRSSRDRVTPIV
jgi:hypothetical protein